MATIPDNPDVIEPIFNELRKNFKDCQTKSMSFRKAALKNLLRGYQEMKEQFNVALKKDLGFNEFMAAFTTHTIFETECSHIISGFESWAKTESVPTPIGKTVFIFRIGTSIL